AEKPAVVSTADEIRKILASAKEPLTVKQIFDRCETASETTQIATALHKEFSDGRVERTGSRGSFAYAITADGRSAAENPNLLRSRTHRRVRGRGPRKASALAKLVASPKPRGKKAKSPRKPRAVAAQATTPAASQPSPSGDDSAVRLAGAVLAHWPAPLEAMPADLRTRVHQTLGSVP
ncbi:MAG: hypothetical protein ACTHK2_15665, partial [Dokdonella sp.]|uniref:hypothetical protein n=1 Tax=Dokdonella sp. TaxID=2291710 RepID=UPI003F7EAB0A